MKMEVQTAESYHHHSIKSEDIAQFLCDVRDYFKASLATSEYENTSNVFYLTASEVTEHLLERCIQLLEKLNHIELISFRDSNAITEADIQQKNIKNIHNNTNSNKTQNTDKQIKNTNSLDMPLNPSHQNNLQTTTFDSIKIVNKTAEAMNSSDRNHIKENKSFIFAHCQTTTFTHNTAFNDTEAVADDTQIYDICQVTTQGSDGEEDCVLEETQKVMRNINNDYCFPHLDCPYMDLPAGHLSIRNSSKYGQLQRIEKRLFFDQSKKYYCGILNDWFLGYAEGPISPRPTQTLYLKIPGIEVEHFGEGKRRDVCFQITTLDPNKRFMFQAINEIDAKEWIHAIEAAIRNDATNIATQQVTRNSNERKLPTPPTMKKRTISNTFGEQEAIEDLTPSCNTTSTTDYIYEEPTNLYEINDSIELLMGTDKPPDLPIKQNSPIALAQKFDYDIPKCQTQLPTHEDNDGPQSEVHLASKLELCNEEKLNFQAKIKDVHTKLSSQLILGPNLKKSNKKSYMPTSQNEFDSNATLTSSRLPPLNMTTSASDLKKQKKSITTTPLNSPQKISSKNWFINRLNKNTNSSLKNNITPPMTPTKSPGKYSEKDNLLNVSDNQDSFDSTGDSQLSSNPASPILKSPHQSSLIHNGYNCKSKVNMIINQLEASGRLPSIIANANSTMTYSAIADEDSSNYEPIMMQSSSSIGGFRKKT